MSARRARLPGTNAGTYTIDVWRSVGAIIRRELTADQEQVLAALLGDDVPAVLGLTPDRVIAGIRELADAGYLAVDTTGRAYLTRPVRGPFGTMTSAEPRSPRPGHSA